MPNSNFQKEISIKFEIYIYIVSYLIEYLYNHKVIYLIKKKKYITWEDIYRIILVLQNNYVAFDKTDHKINICVKVFKYFPSWVFESCKIKKLTTFYSYKGIKNIPNSLINYNILNTNK